MRNASGDWVIVHVSNLEGRSEFMVGRICEAGRF